MALQLRARRIEHIQLEEKETTSKKRSASAAPSARMHEFEGPKAKAASAKPIPPRPQRDPPRFVLQAHEVRVGDELDTDWTRSKEWGRELELREERNELIKAQLLEGKTAAYRQSGWSLYPRIYSNDICCYTPVTFDESVDAPVLRVCASASGGRHCCISRVHLEHKRRSSPSGARSIEALVVLRLQK